MTSNQAPMGARLRGTVQRVRERALGGAQALDSVRGSATEERPMPVTRESIELALRALNDAENSGSMTAAEKSAAIDGVFAADAHGWANGADRGGRDAERQFEAVLFSSFPNYQRQFEEVIVDPPRASVRWRVTGSSEAMEVDLSGATFFDFDEDGKIKESWLYFHDPVA